MNDDADLRAPCGLDGNEILAHRRRLRYIPQHGARISRDTRGSSLMGKSGRRPDAGAPRTATGRKSRSAEARAYQAWQLERQRREEQRQEAERQTAAYQESIEARARVHGLTRVQAARTHAGTVEGLLYLRGELTLVQAEAASQYKLCLWRYQRQISGPAMPSSPFRQYFPRLSSPMAEDEAEAAAIAASRHFGRAQTVIERLKSPAARWAINQLCRQESSPPRRLLPALREACQALAVAFGLDAEEPRGLTRRESVG